MNNLLECGRLGGWRWWAPMAALCWIVGLSGCTVGPDFQRPGQAMPGHWSWGKRGAGTAAAVAPAELSHWWRRFGDRQMTAMVEHAVESNLDVQQAGARLRQARAERRSAGAAFWPWLSGSGRELESQSGGDGPAAGHARTYQAGLSAAWEVDVFGGTRRRVESADARVAAAAADLDAVRLSLAAEVAMTYCQLRATQDQLEVARRNLATQQQTVAITRERRSVGFVSDLDVANATALAANTQAAIPRLETALASLGHALDVLLGRAPVDLDPLLAKRRPVPLASGTVPTGIPSELLRRRPDIRRAEAEAHAATARIGVAVADLFPKFSLTGSLSQQSARLNDWLSPAARASSFGPSFNWALFQAGNLHAQIQIEEALRDQAVLNYRKSVLVALREVEDGMTGLRNERRRHDALVESVRANQRALELSTELYRAGQADFINVLNAQRSLLLTESELAQSNLAIAERSIELYKALGGGW